MPKDYEEILAAAGNPNVLNLATLVEAALTMPGAMNLQGGGPPLKAVWSALRKEVHELLCTNSKKYAKERALLKSTAKPALVLLSSSLIKQFGLEIGTASSLASLCLLLPFRLATGAWCSAYAEGKMASKVELEELRRLRAPAK